MIVYEIYFLFKTSCLSYAHISLRKFMKEFTGNSSFFLYLNQSSLEYFYKSNHDFLPVKTKECKTHFRLIQKFFSQKK